MYDYVKSLKILEKEKIKNLLKYNPLMAINKFIEILNNSFDDLKKIEEMEKVMLLEILQKNLMQIVI